MAQQQPLSQWREQRLAPQIQKGWPSPKGSEPQVCRKCGARSGQPAPASCIHMAGEGNRGPGQAWMCPGEPGGRGGRHRLSAPADTHQLRRVLPFQTQRSLRGGKDSCRRASKAACEAAAGTGRARVGAGAVCRPHSGSLGTRAALTSWMKIRSGFQMSGLPLPAQPGQLDPPKMGSLLSAAFYRTIKPEVQVRSLRPVVSKAGFASRALLPFPTAAASPPGRAQAAGFRLSAS